MKRYLVKFSVLAILLLLVPAGVIDAITVHTFQVTIGASATQVTTGTAYVRAIYFQNNAAHSMRIGDANVSATRGALLSSGSPGGSFNVGPAYDSSIDVSSFWVSGTQNDVLDVIWIN